MIMKSAVPALPVTNMAEGVVFYHETLGFDVSHQDLDYAVLRCDRVSLHLWLSSDESWRDRMGKRPIVSGTESFIAGTHSCRIEVEGIEEIHQDLRPKGIIHPNGQLANKPWGTREFAVLDPYGNLVTFFEKI
ncbi:MAG: VOC family protein [Verrucomicrobia bacterium]|nr:VOC family protein [Verrucomicrobiota bacterium]MDA1065883.1 VOC family protein [Verrucomicrobiota bacterium]